MRDRQRHVFVLALDPFGRRELETVECDGGCVFHGVFNCEEVLHATGYRLAERLAEANRQLDDSDGPIDAIITHWDFPFSVLAPMLCAPRALRSPTLEAVLKCSHKYWSRLEQLKAIPEFTPGCAVVNPFEDVTVDDVGVSAPFWLKPIAAYASQLGFRISSQSDLDQALEKIRKRINDIGGPFEEALQHADLPPEISGVGPNRCIAEEYLTGVELAHEGSVFNGEVTIHGTIDMVREREMFTRYEHPSIAPSEVLDRMETATERLLSAIGFDQGCFNAEYFWEPSTDRLSIIEVNPRISQSHSYLFEKVHGRSNHQVAVDVALGVKPTPPGGGRYARAAKFIYNRYEDGFVERVPDEAGLRRAREVVPDAEIAIVAEEGAWLSDNGDQDAYSYDLAEISVAADDQLELIDRYNRVVEALEFQIQTA